MKSVHVGVFAIVAAVVAPVVLFAEQADPLVTASETSDTGFQEWLTAFRSRALAAGIDGATFDIAMRDVRVDANVVRRDRNQSEFTKTIWDYLATATSDARIENGKRALAGQREALEQIEKTYGVEKEIVVAIWGLESAYGTFRGDDNVISSLASLAYEGRRQDFFEGELIEALKILQAGDTSAAQMTGSWAGAMGHTQFMPSSFQLHAVDFSGDAKRDIWSDDPRDALASTATYLKHFGWTTGQPWGIEVQLPDGFDYLLGDREVKKTPQEWADLGVVGLNGEAVPVNGPASILLPGGAKGAAFMIFDNFAVLEKYNSADAYVIGVGHLSDRLEGGKPIQHSWPLEDRALSFAERMELQTQLTAMGFDTVKIDGKIGPLTINAVRKFQISKGVAPDGYASVRLLDLVREAR